MLQVWFLGQFQVRVNHQRVTIPSRAAQSLLAYLTLTAGTPHRREKLAGMLWPEMPEANARNNFRHELWRLRKALTIPEAPAAEYLLSEEFVLTFNPAADYWLDVAQLERPPVLENDLDDLISRVTLYRGDLLPGFYDDWVGAERDRIQALFEARMDQLLRRLLVEERWQTAVEWAERWIGLGHTPEAAYRALMLSHSARGETGKLLADYERCVAALRGDLDMEPSAETRALYCKLTHTAEPPAPEGLVLSTASAPHQKISRAEPEPPAAGAPPYKGLEFFDQADTALFFGREPIVARLADELAQGGSLAVVIGASGSGKSSLVRAGLVPALKNDRRVTWHFHVITPTAHPLQVLAAELTRDNESVTATATLIDDLAKDPRALHLYLERLTHNAKQVRGLSGARILLVIDQFEELFTLCHDALEREQFIDNLVYAQSQNPTSDNRKGFDDSPLTLVLALRSDFYAHIAQYPELRALVSQHQEYLGPMSVEDLRRAIQEPTRQGCAADGASWEFEPGLVDLILRDVGDEPGALPLLSHALLETWKRCSGHVMTLQGYHDAGGVRGAIAQTAETTYQQLDAAQQEIARSIFLRLTQLGEGTEDTRRRVLVHELISHSEHAETVLAVLNVLARARLVTLGHDTAEVAHEALIREWTRLRGWLNEDRDGLRLHRQLTDAAQEWELMERDASTLYRGTRLAQALDMTALNPNVLNAQERAFLEESERYEKRDMREREAQRQRELASAQALAETQRRAAKQLERRALLLTAAFVLAAFLAGLAWLLGEQARSNAAAAQQNAQAALIQQNIAAARELAASAFSNLTVDPERSILLALQSIATTRPLDNMVLPEAESALHQALTASRLQMTLREHSGPVTAISYSPDGKRIATASSDGAARIWDAATGTSLLILRGHQGGINDLAFSPDGTRLATASTDNTAKLWDLATGQEWLTLQGHSNNSAEGVTGSVFAVAFSPDGKQLATTGSDLSVRLWDTASGQQGRPILGLPGWARTLSYSPNGKHIVAGFDNGVSWGWEASTGQKTLLLYDHEARVNSIVYSPDGKRILTADRAGIVKVWDAETGTEIFKLIGHNTAVRRAAYSVDGKYIATASTDGTVKLWDSALGTELFTLYGHSAGVNDVAFSPDCVAPPEHPFTWCSTRVATAGEDETAKIWDVTPFGSRELLTLPGIAGAFLLDGSHLVTISSFDHNDIREQIWDISQPNPQELNNFSLAGHQGIIRSVAFNSTSSQLATGGGDSQIKLWDIPTGKNLTTFFIPHSYQGLVSSVGFSADGQKFAAGGLGSKGMVWNIAQDSELFSLPAGRADISGEPVPGIALSPDGQRVITTDSVDGTAQVWNIATGTQQLTLGGPEFAVASIAYSPDGKRIATGSFDGTAKIWDAETGAEQATLSGHTGAIRSLAFSPDGTKLVTGSLDTTVRLWDATSGQERVTFSGQNKAVTHVAFSADGTKLAVSSMDGSVKLYLLGVQDLIELARTRLTRTWTLEECKKFLHSETCPQEPKE